MQHVLDSWCSTISSTVIAVVLAFCNTHDLKNSNENHQEFAAQYLKHLHFLYHKADGDDAKVNMFILLIHLSSYEHQQTLEIPVDTVDIVDAIDIIVVQ